ncbi:MAG: methyltransferase domain-containing protein [Nitrospirae bacterium]|nr:methyltransferase domain-containing protein [Nitrospirota bacterium]
MNKLAKIGDILICPSCRAPLLTVEDARECTICKASYPVLNNKSLSFITDPDELKANYIWKQVFDYDYGSHEQKIISEHADEVILEIGSGINTLRDAKYENVILLEIYPYPTTDVVCYGEKLPFADNSVGGIFCSATLEHVRNPFTVMAEFVRVLRPGGHIKIDNPFVYPYHSYPDHYFNTSISGIKELCKDFIPEEVGVGGHQLPCYSISEILTRYLSGVNDIEIKHRIENMTITQFLDFLKECKDNYSEDHISSDTIVNLAAGVFFVGYKKEESELRTAEDNANSKYRENLKYFDRRIKELEETINDKDKLLSAIYKTAGWRLLEKYRNNSIVKAFRYFRRWI